MAELHEPTVINQQAQRDIDALQKRIVAEKRLRDSVVSHVLRRGGLHLAYRGDSSGGAIVLAGESHHTLFALVDPARETILSSLPPSDGQFGPLEILFPNDHLNVERLASFITTRFYEMANDKLASTAVPIEFTYKTQSGTLATARIGWSNSAAYLENPNEIPPLLQAITV